MPDNIFDLFLVFPYGDFATFAQIVATFQERDFDRCRFPARLLSSFFPLCLSPSLSLLILSYISYLQVPLVLISTFRIMVCGQMWHLSFLFWLLSLGRSSLFSARSSYYFCDSAKRRFYFVFADRRCCACRGCPFVNGTHTPPPLPTHTLTHSLPLPLLPSRPSLLFSSFFGMFFSPPAALLHLPTCCSFAPLCSSLFLPLLIFINITYNIYPNPSLQILFTILYIYLLYYIVDYI